MKIVGKVIINNKKELNENYFFKKITKVDFINDLTDNFNCLVVEYLRPEYAVLLPALDLIITKNGSKLSHLAILAMSSGKQVILSENCLNLPESGTLEITQENDFVEIITKDGL